METVVLDHLPDALTLVKAGAAFILVISLWFACLVLWSARRAQRNRQLRERLDQALPGVEGDGRVLRLWRDGKEATTIVPGMVETRGLGKWLDDLWRDAGFETSLRSGLFGLSLLIAAAFMLAFLTTANMLIGLAASVLVLILCWIFIQQRIARRLAVFERQFIDALELASRSLRAGHPLVGSIQLIAEEIPAPVGEMFGTIWKQQDLGMPLEKALRDAAADASEDVKLFATSVSIQLRSGGNLADMMERLVAVIRERGRLARRIRILTTQTQFSKRILLALPFIMFVLLNVINPEYMRPLVYTTLGHLIIAVAGVILLIGWWMMNWLANLKY